MHASLKSANLQIKVENYERCRKLDLLIFLTIKMLECIICVRHIPSKLTHFSSGVLRLFIVLKILTFSHTGNVLKVFQISFLKSDALPKTAHLSINIQ